MKLLRSISMVVLLIICAGNSIMAQTYFRITSDTARIVNGELIIGNQTQSTQGVLINKGNGVTQFQKLQLINIGDSLLAIAGQDTLQWNGNINAGKYYILSDNIPVLSGRTYHPLAFEAPLDSGKMYHVHALIYLTTAHAYDTTSILQSQFSDTVINDEINVYNVGMDTTNGADRYFLEFDKFIQSNVIKDTFKLYFRTNIDDATGNMAMDSLSYLYVEKVSPKVVSPYYTVDTLPASRLKPWEYYVTDSAAFNFTPVAQNIPGWVDVVGEPTKSVVSATASDGITVSTIGTDSSLWRGDPSHGDSVALICGVPYELAADPFGFVWNKNVIRTGFQNYKSQYVPGKYNLKIGGLDKDHLYQIEIIGSYFDSVSNVPLNYAHDNWLQIKDANGSTYHISNTVYNTSRVAIFDTLHPDVQGELYLSITGMDTTYSSGSAGIISAIKVYEISKTNVTTARTDLYRHFYDTAIMVNDGTKDRLCIAYKPYNYMPSKSYPMILYLAGDESKVKNDNWDAQFLTNFGLSFVAEKLEGNVYGINKTGDTVTYIIFQPQESLGENLDTTMIDNLVANFKAKGLYNINDSLYIAGFSSGGADASNYLFYRPSKLKGAFIQSPYGRPPMDIIRTSSPKFKDDGIHVTFTERWDGGFEVNADSMERYIYQADSSAINVRIFPKNHSGFAYEYLPSLRPDKWNSNLFDQFANPVGDDSMYRKYSWFVLNSFSPNPTGRWWGVDSGSYFTPSDRDYRWQDSLTGVIVRTKANGWSRDPFGGYTYSSQKINLLRNTQIFNGSGMQSSQYSSQTSGLLRMGGSYAANGSNLFVSGLAPGGTYTIWMGGYADTLKYGNNVITQYGINGSQFKTMDNSMDNSITPLVRFDQVSADSNGNINISVYPDPDSTNYGMGVISMLVIAKE